MIVTSAEPAPVPGARSFALTFDDGPNPPDTERLLDVLAEFGVTAVFCLMGEAVRAHPEVAAHVVAAGHLVGNHTMQHDDLGEWSADRVRAELLRTTEIIEDATGASVPYFRAPYGRWGASARIATELGMTPLGWQVEVGDWLAPPSHELVARIRSGLEPGGVVLLHDGGGDRSGTVAAVRTLLSGLLADGWHATLPLRSAPATNGAAR